MIRVITDKSGTYLLVKVLEVKEDRKSGSKSPPNMLKVGDALKSFRKFVFMQF